MNKLLKFCYVLPCWTAEIRGTQINLHPSKGVLVTVEIKKSFGWAVDKPVAVDKPRIRRVDYKSLTNTAWWTLTHSNHGQTPAFF